MQMLCFTKSDWMNFVAENSVPLWEDRALVKNYGNGRFVIEDDFGEEDFNLILDQDYGE